MFSMCIPHLLFAHKRPLILKEFCWGPRSNVKPQTPSTGPSTTSSMAYWVSEIVSLKMGDAPINGRSSFFSVHLSIKHMLI